MHRPAERAAQKRTFKEENMNDAYSELLVKKEQTIKEKAIKVLVIALIVLAAVAGIFITPIALVVAVVLGAAAYFCCRTWIWNLNISM